MSSEVFVSRVMQVFQSKGKNTRMLTRKEYEKIQQELTSGENTRRSKKYILEEVGDSLRLKRKESNKVVVPIEDLYTHINKVHVKLGHAGRDVMVREIQKIYHNIGYREVSLYIDCCKECQLKAAKVKKGIVVKPILEEAFNSRCQVDLIDMQSRPDGEYNFIFVYQDHFTKFLRLRALKTKTAEEVADNLLDIFMDLGCPSILHSDNGRELRNKLIERIAALWPGCTIVHGKPRHSQSQGSVERSNRDIQNKVISWMNDHKTTRWSECLRYVQYQKNLCFHRGIGMSPFQALYGDRPNNTIDALALPPHILKLLNTEDDLKALTEKVQSVTQEEGNEADSSTEGVDSDTECTHSNIQSAIDEDAGATSSTENIAVPSSSTNDRRESDSFSKKDYVEHVKRIEEYRKEVRKRAHDQALSMVATSAKRVKTAEVGATVRIRVPDVDRGRTDHLNILGVILSRKNSLFEIGTEYGILDKLYSRNQFDLCKEQLLKVEDVKTSVKKVSLREIVGMASISRVSQGFVKCTCKNHCATRQCSCRKKGLQCNSRCHKTSAICKNK